MGNSHSKTFLFTGHAPVHFVCFRPMYERLMTLPGYEVFVSGGLETKTKSGVKHNERAMYEPFGLSKDRVLSVEEIKTRDFDVLFSANTKPLLPKKAGTLIQIFHGISFRNMAVRESNMGYDFYFIVGPYMHRKFLEADLFMENDPRAVKIGFPKTDRLLNGELKREDLLRQYEFDGSRPILLYAPTGQRHNSLDIMGKKVIRRLVKSEKYDLLIKPHDHPKDTSFNWPSKLARLEDAHTRPVQGNSDVIPLLFLADLLITDASSVSNEYSLMDRPVVFLDVPKLIKKTIKKGALVDLGTWGRRGGVVVKRPEDVVEAVSSSLKEPMRCSDIHGAMARDLFYNPGSATEKAIAWLRERFS